MKVYNKREKSWSLSVDRTDAAGCVNVSVVDSVTGKNITNIIRFMDCGDVFVIIGARDAIEVQGYDPYEHGNKWTAGGAIVFANKV